MNYTAGSGVIVQIREAEIRDALQVMEHTLSVMRESEFMVTTPEEFTISEAQERQWIREHMDDPQSLLLVAVVKGRVVGLLSFKGSPRKRLSHHGSFGISVRQGYRDLGIGHFLLHELITWATDNPLIEKISLEVFSTNERAIHLYKKFGFKEEGRRVRQIKLGDGRYIDDVLMYRFTDKKLHQ